MISPIPALHVRLEGLTASFRHLLSISGTQVSTPVPSYSNLLGMISACAGRIVRPDETRIGFEFHCRSHDLEIERKDRLALKGGKLKPFRDSKAPKDYRLHIGSKSFSGFLEEVHQGVGLRQVYWYPTLDLYVTNIHLKSAFENPASTPCFGRSQDIAWIVFTREVNLHYTKKGKLGPTLIPKVQIGVPGLIVRSPEWIDNSKRGYVRELGPFGVYQAINSTTTRRFEVEGEEFYHPSDAEQMDDVIYLHRWLRE